MQIQNPDATQAIRDQAKLTLSEGYPQNLLPNVQAVMDMTPRFHRFSITSLGNTTSSGTGNVYVAVTGRKLYITGVMLSIAKDATCDAANGNVSVIYTQGGISKTLIAIPYITLTAAERQISITLRDPIPVDEGTNVTFASTTFTAGTLRRVCVLYGYELTSNGTT